MKIFRMLIIVFVLSAVYAWSDVKAEAAAAGKTVNKWFITGNTDTMTDEKINSVKIKNGSGFLKIITKKIADDWYQGTEPYITPDFIIGDSGPDFGISISFGNNNLGPYRSDMILMRVDTGKVYYFFATYWFRLKVYKNFEISSGKTWADPWLKAPDKNLAWKDLFNEMRAGNKIRIRLFDGKEIVYSLMGFTKVFNKSFSNTVF